MKKIYLIFIACIVFAGYSNSQNTDLLWLKQLMGVGNGNMDIQATTKDNAGNIYLTGNFTRTISCFGNIYSSNGGSQDIYVIKINNKGEFVWGFTISGANSESVWGIDLSLDNNYLYISGQYNSTNCNFNGIFLSSTGDFDIFLGKYNVTDGAPIWVYNVAYGTTRQTGGIIKIDKQNNILLLGKFINSVTFYPGTVTLNSLFGAIPQGFLTKFNSNGNVLWAKLLSSNNSNTFIKNVTATLTDYYFSGQYSSNLIIDAYSFSSTLGTRDIILFKTDLDGNIQWVRQIKGTDEDYLSAHFTDDGGYTFFGGFYLSPSLTVDSTETDVSLKILPNNGGEDILFGCYNQNGTLQWVKNYGSPLNDRVNGIFANNSKILLAGEFSGKITFGNFTLFNQQKDGFMLETDRSSNEISVIKASGSLEDLTKLCFIDNNNTNFFAGQFKSTDFRISEYNLFNDNINYYDIFLSKFGKIDISFNVTDNTCYGDNNGSIDLTVSGDVIPPLSYNWSGPNGFSSNNEDIYNLYSGWYKVTITDNIGAKKVDSTYLGEKSAIGLIFNTIEPSCFGYNNGKINLTVVGGLSPYSYLWSNGQITEDITNIPAGKYKVTVTDAFGCSKIDSVIVMQPSEIVITYTLTNPSCMPGDDGLIDIEISGGTPQYAYLWSNGSTNQDISNLNAGVYSVTVTDFNGCTKTKTFNLNNPPSLSLSYFKQNVSCHGNDGAIDLIVTGGTMPYTFLWSNGATTEDLSGVGAGLYSVTVSDGMACTRVLSDIVVSQSVPPSISYDVRGVSCHGGDGAIDLIVTGGTMPYTFLWSNGATTEDLSGIGAGLYSVTVSDGMNCTSSLSNISLNQYNNISISKIINYPTCVPNNDGSIDIIVYNGNPPYTYLWNTGSNSEDLSGLAGGTYIITITDASNCSVQDTIKLFYIYPTVFIQALGNTTFCEGDSLIIIANSPDANNLTWFYNSNPIVNFNGILYTAKDSGIYYVVATNQYGCTSISNAINVNVHTKPSLVFSVSGNPICEGDSIYISVSGADTYMWDNGSISDTLALQLYNTTTYFVTGTNINGCTNSNSIQIVVNKKPQLSAAITNQQCTAASGIIDINVESGTAPYTFLWSTGETSEDIYNLLPGNYTVTVTTADNCTSVYSVNIQPYQQLIAFLNIHEQILLCATSNNGSAYVIAEEGIAPYTYLWSDGSITPFNNNLSVGIHYVTVTDQCGSNVVDSIVITSLPPLQATLNLLKPSTCQNTNDGIAFAEVTGGTEPISYLWSNSSTQTNIAYNLPFGQNFVTISDVCGDTIIEFYVDQLPPLSISITKINDVKCSGQNNGAAQLNINNGVEPYVINWSTGDTSLINTNLIEGYNYVTVTDACTTLIDSVFIGTTPSLSVNSIFVESATCENTNDGKAVIIFNQTGPDPLTIQWANSNSTSYIATNLPPGWNYVTITDGCGVQFIDTFFVGYSTPMVAFIKEITNVECATDNTGSISVSYMYGVPPYSFVWSNGDTDSVADNISAGVYYVTVSDYCKSITLQAEVKETSNLTTSFVSKDVTCYGKNDGQIIITAENGALPYSYQWSGGISSTNSAFNLSANKYTIIVTDRCGKSDTIIVEIKEPGELYANFDVTPASFENTSDGAINTFVFGGITPYSFSWSNGSTSKDINNLTYGTYYITITDYNGCTISDTVFVDYKMKDIEVFNTFTPNGDGINDKWTIRNIENYPECVVKVYNEWGMLVFESKGYTEKWDGTKDGKQVSAGTYYYVIDLKTANKVYTGSLTILK
ncbi:MAG: gliding motility-associated C-terminal domain-containing protein [Bacteroidales bacterium]|nr:gliding motility-associated C-terminal domain-containing protein [Bacteroidales bacterium]